MNITQTISINNTEHISIQHPDSRLMERVRTLERNEHIRRHLGRMKLRGYTLQERQTWLVKMAILSDFTDIFTKFLGE